MAQAQMVGFRLPKEGGEIWDWEDFFAYDARDGSARCVVLDGATEAFDSQRWARQLADGFLALHDSVLDHLDADEFLAWIEQMQQRWQEDTASVELNPFEEIKLRKQGSLATFLGCQISGLNGPDPTWRAVALGDVVLFHVRAGRLIDTFPRLTATDFGIDPVGMFTLSRMNPRMRAAVQQRSGRSVQVGDVLYLATDAFAEWLVRSGPHAPWGFLADLDDEHVFADFVRRLRAADVIKNDDVTLLRVEITKADPEYLVVGR